MDHLVTSCESFYKFPTNVVRQFPNCLRLEELFRQLEERDKAERPLFEDDVRASLDFWDLNEGATEFTPYGARSLDDVKKHLSKALEPQRHDPLCRFIFVHAAHSRAPLRVTRPMLMFTFSYHQIMPAFIELILPFGDQEYPQDFHFSAFRHDSQLRDSQRGLIIPEIGRSGRELRLCYTLKSVEASKEPHWPWSIRQISVHQSFDVDTGRATWIVLKGNESMKQRVHSMSTLLGQRGNNPFRSHLNSLEDALSTHLLFCEWASENWGRYISYLEQVLQMWTRKALYTKVDGDMVPLKDRLPPVQSPSRTPTCRTDAGLSFHTSRTNSSWGEKMWWHRSDSKPMPSATLSLRSKLRSLRPKVTSQDWMHQQAVPRQPSMAELTLERMQPPDLPPGRGAGQESGKQGTFSFSDLQFIQQLEEKAQETILVIRLNRKIILELRKYYEDILRSPYISEDMKGEAVLDFVSRVGSIDIELEIQESRASALLRLLEDRKNLMYGILEFRTMEASQRLTEKAQVSAEKMEDLTERMHWIAQRTQRETVSMKIITLVTLFFLPGTFISTIMSTDIVRFSKEENTGEMVKTTSTGALQLYMAITVPLMVLTFLSWYGVQLWEKRKEKRSQESGEEAAKAE